jgi:hypothetical protein
MERGPMALFGAIVAIGLGPAMWLGAQFGQATLSPERPPAVTSVRNEVEAPRGGSGAGDAPTEAEAIRTEPKSNTEPLNRTKNARPAGSKSASPSPSPSDGPSTPPSDPPTQDPPDPGESETTPPTESSTPPQEPPKDEEPDVPPEPPAGPAAVVSLV